MWTDSKSTWFTYQGGKIFLCLVVATFVSRRALWESLILEESFSALWRRCPGSDSSCCEKTKNWTMDHELEYYFVNYQVIFLSVSYYHLTPSREREFGFALKDLCKECGRYRGGEEVEERALWTLLFLCWFVPPRVRQDLQEMPLLCLSWFYLCASSCHPKIWSQAVRVQSSEAGTE